MTIRNLTQRGLWMIIGILAACSANAQTPVLVYDLGAPTQNPVLGISTLTGATQIGDRITISPVTGTSNIELTEFRFDYNAVGGGSATIRFYEDNAGSPGAVFWTSDAITLIAGVNTQPILNLNGAIAPSNTFFWAAEFSDTDDQLLVYGAPTVGSGTGEFWSLEGGTWESLSIASGPNAGTPVHFGAQVYAVPEPTTIVFGILGGLALFGARRFRR